MAKGKKTSTEDIYRVMTSWAVLGSYSDVGRALGMPSSTVRAIVKKNKDKPEFAKLCAEKKKIFSEKAEILIFKAASRLEKALDDELTEIPVNHLTTVIGTLYDKKALADGDATENVTVDIKLPPEADNYAG